MKKLRDCASGSMNTGTSKCPIDFAKIIGAIIVSYGYKLPADLTADQLEELAHADSNDRIYGIVRFVEYAKNGGEAQTATNGYGPEEFNGFSARKDTYTLNRFSPELNSNLIRNAHLSKGVYFFDESNFLYGLDDGTDTLAPFPVSSIYSDVTPHPTSSAKSAMTVTFCFEDVKQAYVDFDYVKLDFNPAKLTLGLVDVVIAKVGDKGSEYKIYEKVGRFDVTGIYGPLLATAGEKCFANNTTTAVTYNTEAKTLTIALADGAEARLKSPAVLYKNGSTGIEQVA